MDNFISFPFVNDEIYSVDPSLLDEKDSHERPREMHEKYLHLGSSLMTTLRDVVVFACLGILFGLVIDYIFPFMKHKENAARSFVLLILQIIVSAFVIFMISFIYNSLFEEEPDTYLGITVFVLVFFALQTNIFVRVSYIWFEITGHTLVRYVDFGKPPGKGVNVMAGVPGMANNKKPHGDVILTPEQNV